MADTNKPAKSEVSHPRKPRGPSRYQQLNKLYALPAPLRTFPLPTFTPHNPLSLFHLVYVWVLQVVNPPASHFEAYIGYLSPDGRSIHVTENRSIRGLWEQGFYGKGNLSRSEPSWLEREKTRKGASASLTSEEVTSKRRAERQQTKWERARKEREAIDQTLLEEAEAARKKSVLLTELNLDLKDETTASKNNETEVEQLLVEQTYFAPVGPLQLLALPNSIQSTKITSTTKRDLTISTLETVLSELTLDSKINNHVVDSPEHSSTHKEPIDAAVSESANLENHDLKRGSTEPPTTNGDASQMKRRKSVRFSSTVENNTFQATEPPSPEYAIVTALTVVEDELPAIVDREHFQLTLEETFFLSYALGALTVLDPITQEVIPTRALFSLFRVASYVPPRAIAAPAPDDPFLVSYVVYHHFRSLGWIVRGGTKFSCDFLLYNRGPVFSHAEFGILILPAYSDEFWESPAGLQHEKRRQNMSWSWLHSINRVAAQVKKTLMLVYVEIPAPLSTFEEEALGVHGCLARYTIQEVIVKRWISNRSRD